MQSCLIGTRGHGFDTGIGQPKDFKLVFINSFSIKYATFGERAYVTSTSEKFNSLIFLYGTCLPNELTLLKYASKLVYLYAIDSLLCNHIEN